MWAALNVSAGDARASAAQARATEEAQDADNTALYEQALRCQQRRESARARELYEQLLSGAVAVSSRLEYLCHKNLASMEVEARAFEAALSCFARALALDATDVVVWSQMGEAAVETGKLWLARRALEEGLKVDASYWPLARTLAEVLHEVGDAEAYARVAAHIRAHDPLCASVRLIDGPNSEKMGANRDSKLLRRARKRLSHLHSIVQGQTKRRKVLEQQSSEQLKRRMQSRTYELQQPSWSALGKVLLEAFEDGNRSDGVDVIRAAVQIQVSYEQVEVERVEEEEEEEESDEAVVVAKTEAASGENQPSQEPPAKRAKQKEVVKVAAALETSLSTGVSDNDTPDSGIQLSDLLEFPPRRRKSRRNEERLREEHAAAVKKAREKDLAYRLGAYLPEALGEEERGATPDSVSIEWLPPLNIHLVDSKFRVSNADQETVAHIPSFIFPSSSEGATTTVDSQSSRKPSRDRTASGGVSLHAEIVSGKRISAFVSDSESAQALSVMDWVRHYLNQCGRWAHLKLGGEDENIHTVCTWLEKVLNGELDTARTPRGTTQSSIINVADHSLVRGSRFEGNGLTLGAQLFLLELHFDMLLQQPVRGKRRRKMKTAVESQLAQAQKLLFEFGWLEDSEETTDCPSGSEFLRLLWLIARMHERCGNPQMAQHYFSKCRDKLLEMREGDGSNDDKGGTDDSRVELPNQKADNEITLEILDEKISGLRFSDVCSEAQRVLEAGDHDHVVSVLLGHFFPANQAPRMMDFLNEFEIDEDDPSARGESNKKRIEMVLESLRQSSKYSDDDTVLFLLTTMYYVIGFLDGLAVTKEPSTMDDSPDEACTNALAALEFLLAQLTQNQCERISTSDHWLLLRALSIRCLEPTILLRYDSPSDVLSMIRAALEINPAAGLSGDDGSMAQMIGVDAMARLLYVIRSLSSEDFRNLFTLVPHPVKRKQPRRDRIRVVLVELLRFVNRAIQGNEKLAVSLPLPKRSALMTVCCALMKEEEETVARSDGKIPRQLFGNGAILFVLLFESFRRPDLPASLPQLVDLIHLLHERLGQHGICGLTYFSDSRSSADSGKTSCFLESCTLLLSKFVKTKTSVRDEEKAIKISGDSSAEEDNEDEEETEYRFQKEVCQCYRCLYDVQILPGTDDHKTGATVASLQNQERSLKHEDALRLTRFAVPILLATKPKTNGQKKERLKLLYAVRDALSDSDFAALSAQPASVSPPLEAYLAPRGLLQEDVPPPFSLGVGTATKSPDETCLGHLWYLLGANFILARVKRRGNLGELMEMEQHVRERVEFLMKDVLYYHPDRIDSWIRLGKTMKELYHAATDAFAAVLGRKLRIQALRWYTAKIFVEDSYQDDVLSFQKVVMRWSLFNKIKEWQGKYTDGHKAVSKASNSKDSKEGSKENTDQNQPAPSIPIEEFAMTYIAQVIEFARRCFDMAVRLAEEAATNRKLKLQSKRESADEGAEGEGDDAFDEQLDVLRNTLIECNEECGLLLYNVLQEFSLMKELSAALFPLTVYSRLVEKTLAYFRRGLAICEANEDAHEDHFRLLYMTGKTLKKMRWCELRRQELSDLEALSTATEMADCFAKAEAARDEGDREHALVHAFYSLQALRIDLTISESPSVSALRLVCDHFYEEEDGEEVEEEEEEEEGDDESTDSTSIKGTDEKNNSQETVASTASEDSTKTAGSKLTGDTKSASSSRKDDILALLSDAESDEDLRELNVTLARGWLALNIIDALESIPDEDRYFHPSRYVLARLVYWLSTFYSALEQSGYNDAAVSALLDAVLARRNETQVEGPSDAAARALKEMAPIFDKRRPQIVAIWFSEYIPSAKKFEELNQRQMKYDYYRLKYWRFYIALLQENEAYGRLKEVGSWVLACKEDHDVIDIMLGIVLRARGNVLRSRLQVFLDAMEGVSTGRAGDDLTDMTQTQPPGEDRPVDALLRQLAKAYSSYLEVSSAQQRLAHVMDDSSLLLENAELPMVAVFFVGAVAYPLEMPLLEKDRAILDREFNANVVVIKNALRRDELPPRIYDAHGREAWRTYLDAARSFCEEKWPERSGKGKSTKKHSRPKAVAAAPTTASSTDTSQPTVNASS